MTDIAMPSLFQPRSRSVRFTRPGRPGGVIGALNYAGVLLVWARCSCGIPGWPCRCFASAAPTCRSAVATRHFEHGGR